MTDRRTDRQRDSERMAKYRLVKDAQPIQVDESGLQDFGEGKERGLAVGISDVHRLGGEPAQRLNQMLQGIVVEQVGRLEQAAQHRRENRQILHHGVGEDLGGRGEDGERWVRL